MFVRLGALRKLNVLRMFSKKDTQHLKKQFQQMAKQLEKNHKPLSSTQEIRTTNQEKLTDDLRSQFQDVKQGLQNNTGQAKSTYQRIRESYSNFSLSKIKLPTIQRPKTQNNTQNQQTQPLTQTPIQNTQQQKQQAQPTIKTESPKQETFHKPEPSSSKQIPNQTWSDAYPKFTPIFSVFHATGSFVTQSIKETFPTRYHKLQKQKQLQQKLKYQREMQEKIDRGQISQQDIPEWKRGALTKVQVQESTWESIKSKLANTKAIQYIQSKTSSITKHQSVKQAQEGIQDIKQGIDSVKQQFKQTLQNTGGKIYTESREVIIKARMETAQAKAVRSMRQYDPDFDIYDFEKDLEEFVKDLFDLSLEGKLDFLQSTTSGQATQFFQKKMENYKKQMERREGKIVSYHVTRPRFFSVNLEEKTNPKFYYNVIIWEYITPKHAGITTSKRMNYSFSVMRHEDPNIELVGHPWMISTFQPVGSMMSLTA